jgi:endonuclease/exonuclease/phosphatase (EEP) superfamily protein YafD
MLLLATILILQKGKVRYLALAGIAVTVLMYFNTLLLCSSTKSIVPTTAFKHYINVMDFNLRFDNQHIDKVQEYIRKNKFDIITLQEVVYENKSKFEELKKEYPHQAYCEFSGVGGEMILSRYPFTNRGNCLKGKGLLWREIDVDGERFSLVTLHLHWPFPYSQDRQIATLVKELDKIKGAVILAGDFNASPWSYSVEKIAKASHTKLASGISWTKKFDSSILPMWLPIDHFLISGFYVQSIKVGDDLGSDHLPILVSLLFS